jgi:hypothetical protein
MRHNLDEDQQQIAKNCYWCFGFTRTLQRLCDHSETDASIECYGKSTGLNLESRGEDDAVVIRHQLRRDNK